MKSEQKYYESDTFWNPKNIKPGERERIIDTYKLIPKDVTSIADIGCGNGIFANYIVKKNKKIKVVGVDESISALKYVNTQKKEGNIISLPLKDQEFDLVAALEVIEHLSVEDYRLAQKELARVSKKYILISVPNNENLRSNFIECPECHSQFSRSFHKRSFNANVLNSLFVEDGFSCEYVKKLGQNREYFIISPIYRLIKRYLQRKHFSGVLICPVCNFTNDSLINNLGNKQVQNSFSFKLGKLIKLFWPSYTRYKWLVALYVRRQ